MKNTLLMISLLAVTSGAMAAGCYSNVEGCAGTPSMADSHSPASISSQASISNEASMSSQDSTIDTLEANAARVAQHRLSIK